MPLILHPPGEKKQLWGDGPDVWGEEPYGLRMAPRGNYYANLRVTNPCPEVRWDFMALPTKDQNAEILTALEPLANVRRVVYMP